MWTFTSIYYECLSTNWWHWKRRGKILFQQDSAPLHFSHKGAFTRVPQVDQHGWRVNKLGDGQLSFKVVDSLWVTHPQQSIPKWWQMNLCGKVLL
jgi:hypothetical protein